MRRSDAARGLLLLAACASPSSAHGLHRSDGSFAIAEGVLIVEVQADAGFEGEAAREIVVRDAAGERLPGRIVSAEPDAAGEHVSCAIEHRVPPGSRVLALQLLPLEQRAGHGRRLVLAERGGTRALTLTSGGNVEILRLSGAPAAPIEAPACDGRAFGAGDELSAVHAVLALEDARARVHVVLPLGIAESFAGLPRDEDELLSAAEQEASAAALRELVLARVALRAGGAPIEPVEAGVDFLDLDGMPARGRRLALATARARVSLVHELPPRSAPGAPSEIAISWDLFHARLHSASLLVQDRGGDGGERCAIRELTPASPAMRWSR